MSQISDVIVIGYEGDIRKKEVYEWRFSADGRSILGFDEEGRTIIQIPKHLVIVRYDYAKPDADRV